VWRVIRVQRTATLSPFERQKHKTALASLVLATRYPVRQVVLGAWLAFLVQTL